MDEEENNDHVIRFSKHSNIVNHVMILDDVLFTASSDKSIFSWNIKTKQVIKEFHGHTGAVLALYYHKGFIYSCSADSTIRVWNPKKGKCEKVIKVKGASSVYDITLDDDMLYAACADSTLRQYSIVTWEQVRTFKGHDMTVCTTNILGDVLYSGSWDTTVKCWDKNTGVLIKSLEGHRRWVSRLKIQDGLLFSSSYDGTIRIWDIKTYECVKVIDFTKMLNLNLVNGVIIDFIVVGYVLFIANRTANIIAWNWVSNEKVHTFSDLEESHIHFGMALRYDADTKVFQLYCGCYDGTARIWPVPYPLQLTQPKSRFRCFESENIEAKRAKSERNCPSLLIVGIGEYVTGLSHKSASKSDKSTGVLALVAFDLRKRGLINEITLCGRSGLNFPVIREHFYRNIGDVYGDIDTYFHSYPMDDVELDINAHKEAIDSMKEDDICIIATPDDTHFAIAKKAVQAGLHVLIAKPTVKTLKEHKELVEMKARKSLLVCGEYHKRFDPFYRDAIDRIRRLGSFSYFTSYMSQPKLQLTTFSKWAGRSSDISYYLNSHHIDFHALAMKNMAIPTKVKAFSSNGVADSYPYNLNTEDTITLAVTWKNIQSSSIGTAFYTACWIAPEGEVHSQQRCFYLGHRGELSLDQAHRGYTSSVDGQGHKSHNPLFMKYTPFHDKLECRDSYGYQSVARFVRAVAKLRRGESKIEDLRYPYTRLAMLEDGLEVTAILEAGRLSLDTGKEVAIKYEDGEIDRVETI